MAQSKAKKKMFNMAYGLGAAVVILGALFKIAHFPGGTEMLTIGMIVEAAVFALSAFEPVEEDLDWTNVYPELAGGDAKDKEEANDAQGLLSQKLDDLLQEANLDAEKIGRLSDSISSFAGAAEGIKPATDSIAASNRYAEQLSVAAIELESLNSMYIIQKENAERQASLNQETLDNAERLKEQMESLATNLSSLNGVYGGMLSAMSNRNS
ncbi:gliding motility protein GldL [Lutimonas saemankumensis]|uniref:type IX secretion system motor protein PorL/GldL n=1 Tax=Lutimonas saemankumensis TaxID=483016 RepID=UPI001CD75CAE|nr:gliding motility protein GldL [Lutimonas saemankumensis]MCA0933720.1 gliding motility protein GldL [Lutimonas saemankumensis]